MSWNLFAVGEKIHIITFGLMDIISDFCIQTLKQYWSQIHRDWASVCFFDCLIFYWCIVFLLTYCVCCACINFDIYHYSESLIYKMRALTLICNFNLPTASSRSVFLPMSIHSFSNIFMQTKTIRRTMSLVHIDISQEKNETGFSIGRIAKPEVTQCFRSDCKKHMSNKWTW